MGPILDLSSHTPLGFLDEINQVRDVRRVAGVGRLERAEGRGEVGVLFQEQLFIGEFDRLDVVLGKAPALKSDRVNAASAGGISLYDHERRHILDDSR